MKKVSFLFVLALLVSCMFNVQFGGADVITVFPPVEGTLSLGVMPNQAFTLDIQGNCENYTISTSNPAAIGVNQE